MSYFSGAPNVQDVEEEDVGEPPLPGRHHGRQLIQHALRQNGGGKSEFKVLLSS